MSGDHDVSFLEPQHIDETLKAYLEEHDVRFTSLYYSSNHENREIMHSPDIPHRGYAKTVILQVDDKKVMVVLSVNHRLSFNGLEQIFGTHNINILSTDELKALFPGYELNAIPPFGHFWEMEVIIDKKLAVEAADGRLTFHAGSKLHLIKMNYKDFEKTAAPRVLDLPIVPRYQAGLRKVTPASGSSELDKIDRCFLLTSLANPNFSRARFESVVEWIAKHFSSCSVLVTDWIYRITLRTQNPLLSKQEALHKALYRGWQFLKHELPLFERYSQLCTFTYVFASDVAKTEEYELFNSQLNTLFESNEGFKESINTFARDYIYRKPNNCSDEQNEINLRISCDYLLEELAIFACLYKDGLPALIYPGLLEPLIDIHEGRFPEVPVELQKLVTVALRIRRRKGAQSAWFGE